MSFFNLLSYGQDRAGLYLVLCLLFCFLIWYWSRKLVFLFPASWWIVESGGAGAALTPHYYQGFLCEMHRWSHRNICHFHTARLTNILQHSEPFRTVIRKAIGSIFHQIVRFYWNVSISLQLTSCSYPQPLHKGR